VRALLVALDLPTASEIEGAHDLAWPGANISLAETVEDARALLEREHVDIVFLGSNAASGGLQLCADVCATAPVPVLLVAERRSLVDRLRAIELGVQGILWRPLTTAAVTSAVHDTIGTPSPGAAGHEGVFQSGDLRVDYESRTVTVDDRAITLTSTEYRLLYHLTRNANSVVAYATLAAKVWGRRHAADQDVLTVHVDRLALKLPASHRGQYAIVRRPGFGFGLRVTAEPE
jgi:DNA-binding response OmpR family regulator